MKGTVASAPHCAQMTECISRESRPDRSRRREARQAGQRCGSFISPFSAKNSCSPTVNTNCCAQSRHCKVLSAKLTSSCPLSHLEESGHSLAAAQSAAGALPRNQDQGSAGSPLPKAAPGVQYQMRCNRATLLTMIVLFSYPIRPLLGLLLAPPGGPALTSQPVAG
jgi:hypothetical protein